MPVKLGSCGPYERLLRDLQPTTVISFNYDTLLEQYLDLERRAWTYEALPTGSYPISILKPHGSVNWMYRRRGTHRVQEEVNFCTILSLEGMGYCRGRWLVQNLVVGLRDKIEHTPQEESPGIRRVFRKILGACERALTDAEEVWIVGYRFASADTSFLEILAHSRTCRAKPPLLRVIDFVDPASPKRLQQILEKLRRIRDLFGLPGKARFPYCFCGFEQWANHAFCRP